MDHPEAVDHSVRELGRDDLTGETVSQDLAPELAPHGGREGREQLIRQAGVGRQPARLDRILQDQLGGGQQHRQLGPGEPRPARRAPGERVVVHQPFGPAIEHAVVLELLDQPHVRRGQSCAWRLRDR
jgi:hypothetical protein